MDSEVEVIFPNDGHATARSDDDSSLSANDTACSGLVLGKRRNGVVSVDAKLSNKLKPHQKDGVQFIWRNCFPDWGLDKKTSDLGGCIIAHYMGLGKSLTTIALLHTAMTNPRLETKRSKGFKSLVLAPANVIRNWENEVIKWTKPLKKPLQLFNLQKTMSAYRVDVVEDWARVGGILLMSEQLFRGQHSTFIIKNGQPDILVIDEAHTMLKHSQTKISKQLRMIRTKRKILLTGTPMQNNCTEFYQLVDFIRPGAILNAKSEADFDAQYRQPIEAGLPADADIEKQEKSRSLQSELNETIEPFLHRKGKDCLRSMLPDFHDTLLHLRTSTVQAKIMQLYERLSTKGGCSELKNFFRKYHSIAPLLNHPVCLKLRAEGGKLGKKKKSSDMADLPLFEDWVRAVKKIRGVQWDKLHEMRHSPKFIVTAHILAFVFLNSKEKVLVYTKCLKTLDLLSQFLQSSDWKKSIGSLKDLFPYNKLGGFKKNKDFVRIDGSVESGKRGALVDKFNMDENIRFFLISSEAGGIGINLHTATRVVLMDHPFNPAVAEQCVSRAHRHGQVNPVHCYRLAIEGTLETKIYSRSVNKTGVSAMVIDGERFTHQFSTRELADLVKSDCWVTCADCDKKRRLPVEQDPPGDEDVDFWTCANNEDPEHNDCSHPEEEQASTKNLVESEDCVLNHLLSVVNKKTRKSKLVSLCAPVESSPDQDAVQTNQKKKRCCRKDSNSSSKKQKRH